MASPLLPRAPQCINCVRRIVGSFPDRVSTPIRQQVRGKKKLAKASNNIKVRLLQDIPHYGRKGTILQVAPGRMRNDWFPKNMAEYMTTPRLQELGLENAVSERDSGFMPGVEKQFKPKTPLEDKPIHTNLDLLSPERMMYLVTRALPPVGLEFYRKPIPATQPPAPKHSPSIPASSALSEEALEAQESAAPPIVKEKTGIYGSVSTADIAAELKAILVELEEEGSKVVLSAEDITFVEQTDEKDRVKTLGVFDIDIRIKGAPETIRSMINVLPESMM
ncbi:hypothetical protein F5884DRAFT_359311 [Xylogone sp. PMI_703]|nr:hypothetical protein F5884DRAFT_359311 [Xylogone sp. PMI_703]